MIRKLLIRVAGSVISRIGIANLQRRRDRLEQMARELWRNHSPEAARISEEIAEIDAALDALGYGTNIRPRPASMGCRLRSL